MKTPSCFPFLAATCLSCSYSSAVLTATDDFSSGGLSGGSNWANNWSGGTVVDEALIHEGNNPQQLTRQYSPSVDNTEDFSLCFEFSLDIDESSNQNYGFRSYIESQNNSPFSMVWKNDVNGGNLTFLHGNNQAFQITDPEWNIATSLGLSTIEMSTYQVCVDIAPEVNQNGNAYNGTFNATVTRLEDGESFSTGDLPWGGSNIGAQQFDTIGFFNSSQSTTVTIDNVQVGDAIVAVPEPSAWFLSLGASSFLLLRRKR